MGIDNPIDELAREAQLETLKRRSEHDTGDKVVDDSSDGSSRLEAQSKRRDFDEGANALWSLYSKEAQTHDETLLERMSADMNGVPTFAGLFAAVLTSFLVDSLKNLQPDPAQQSVHYQQQSVAMLAQISQQIASIAPQVSVPSTPPPPYPVFHPSKKDLAVNSLDHRPHLHSVCSAFGNFRSTRYDHPLKRSRLRQIFFDDTQPMKSSANLTILLFCLGISISTFNINNTIGGVTTFCVLVCLTHISPSTLGRAKQVSSALGFGDTFTPRQERRVMGESGDRKGRDVRAIQWLVDRSAASAEMEPLVLAIPGSFGTEWGRDVWKEVSSPAHGTSDPPTGSPSGHQVSLSRSPHPLGATADNISRSMRYLFETCNNHNYFASEEARRRRMRTCVEAAASFICRIDYRLEWFGEVGEVVSEIGPETGRKPPKSACRVRGERTGTLSNGTRTTGRNRTGERSEDRWIAWERADDLRQAFEPQTQNRTKRHVEEILRNHEQLISDLERIRIEADGMKDVDREMSRYQDAVDNVTYGLIRQLPGVSFDEPRRSEPLLISDTFNMPATGSAPFTPQLIFPGQQLRALTRLGLKLREVLDGQVAEGYEEVLESLKSIDQVLVSLRRPNGLMRRQLWRLQDVRDGGGLGFTVELFFLSLRRLLSISSFDESNSVFYTGTFKTITSRWEDNKKSLGTHRVLLDIICDLIIPGRGIFSDYPYPEPITTALVNMVGNMLQEYEGPGEDFRLAVREIENASPDQDIRAAVREIEDAERIRTDRRELQRRALEAFPRFRSNP
ncbi:hypothetical protein EDB86DRAFT_2831424 [Lactarius hatsudake]|nr:hypothetical protein EDB86DRAFT_2831424 [Lactarius hatsudake]